MAAGKARAGTTAKAAKAAKPSALPPLVPGSREAQVAALKLIEECGSHAGWNRVGAEKVAHPFGLRPRLYTEIANDPKNPKGLWIEGQPARTKVESVGGWELIDQIARHLGIADVGSNLFSGRGYQFRHTLAAIQKHLGITNA